jgi:PTS system mannose-specific IIB component
MDPRRIFLLTGNTETMAALATASEGLIPKINLGGIHAGPGRRELLRYVYLSEPEVNTLRRLQASGVVVTAQDLPNATAVPLQELLG